MSEPRETPRLVGRERELAVIADALAAGARGEPAAVIVRGEAGIGKSRLARETADRARAMPGTVVATGACIDAGTVGAPFGAVRRLLHELACEVGVDALGAAAGSARVRGTLARLVPELEDAGDAPPPTGADFVSEAVERVIENLSADHHLVLVLEDLHWADDATRALVRTLGATLRASRLSLVLTYRADDVSRGHPLRAVVAELERNRAIRTLDVGRLERHEVAEQMRLLTGEEPPAAAVAAVHARADGVPLYVEELVLGPDEPLAGTLEDIVLARYERLGPEAQAVARLLSVAGERVDDALLAEAWEGDEADLATGLREGIAAGAMVAVEPGLAFHHALLREAVYRELLPGERVAAHRTFATIFQARVDAGELSLAAGAAHHWAEAHDVDRAFAATAAAVDAARAQYAVATAARLGERLLEMWDGATDPASVVGLPELAMRCQVAEDLRDAGQGRAAMRLIEDTLATAPADGADLERARLHAAAMSLAAEHVGDGAAVAHLEPLEALLRSRDDTDAAALPYRVQALAARAHVTAAPGSAALADACVALSERFDDPAVRSMALCKRAVVRCRVGGYEDALADLREALAIDEGAMLWGRCATANVVDTLNRLGRFDEAVEAGLTALSEAIDEGLERSIGAPITANVAEALVNAGRGAEALPHLRRCAALVRGESPRWEEFLLELEAIAALWDDRLETAADVMRAAEPLVADPVDDAEAAFNWAGLTIDLALARAADASPVESRRLLEHALEAARALLHPEALREVSSTPMLLLAACRAVAAARGARMAVDPAIVARAVEVREAQPPHAATSYTPALAAALLADEDVTEAWRAAVVACESGRPPRRLVHEARLRLALALRRDGDRRAAEGLLATVAREAPAEGAGLVGRWAREALSRRESEPSGLGSLTAREREVLALVAAGMTNPQIGAHLHIAAKTASVHVSAILAKIGAANRAEAAAWFAAHRRDAA
ncbi:AAA family ATPase [Demequina sp. SYSU T00192]|uniref:AAA family ATPase n=1 Tax=Demequina litoralis TaxID=3051660 RepID=A0ABT8G632_9MICO|nr:LuxR family transcriptional regulator [Demequina sp. SYSU T00192]MDN4474578.1 AAA family ATPase [Demequina sp. SYSU T00192]